MNTPNTIVIVGGTETGNQAKLQTQLKPVKLDKNVGIAITSIFHGEVYNVNDGNNKVYFYTTINPGLQSITIPTAHYSSTFAVIKEISDSLNKLTWENVPSGKRPRLDVLLRKEVLTVSAFNMQFLITDQQDSPWSMIGIKEGFEVTKLIAVKNVNYDLNLEPAFLYVNIVENSYINGKLSRVLNMVPISMKAHWSYHEFAQPNFVPIEVREFSKITLEIRNMDGSYVPFDPKFKTIITLQTKSL
jgi:hypothetical protein